MAAPISSVVGFPPMAGVRAFDRAKVSAIASSTASAASEAPRCLSIIAPDHICPMGFAMPLPAISGAEPWTGSNMDGYSFSGFRFAEGAMPIDPTTAGPRSERMSPKRFEPTTTSNRSEEHTSELQSQSNLVCRLLLEKNKENIFILISIIKYQKIKRSNSSHIHILYLDFSYNQKCTTYTTHY